MNITCFQLIGEVLEGKSKISANDLSRYSHLALLRGGEGGRGLPMLEEGCGGMKKDMGK